MRKFYKTLKGFIFISLVLLMTNCATEEIGQKNVTQSTTEAKIWFDANKNNYSATILKYANDIEWQNAIVSNGALGEVVEIPFTLTGKLSTSNKSADLYNDHHRLMFIKGENNRFKLFDVQIFTDKENSKILDKNYNYYNIKDNFDGTVFVKELATNIASKLEFKNGNKIVPSLTSRMAEEVIECVYLGYWYEDGHFEPIELVYCDGGGSTGEPSPSGGYGGGGGTSGSGSGSGTTGLTTFQKIEKNIVSDKLDACTKAVLEKLKNLKQSDIAVMLARFNPEGSIIFNLNMITGTVSNPSNIAETTKVLNSSTDVNMVFSQNYINGTGNVSPPTDLSVATTMAHEIIHAYLISRLEEFKSCGAQGIICDFPTVYDAYVQQQIDKDKNKTLTVERHHEIIADDYVYAIASIIQEFHTGEIVTSGFPRQVYLDMAWGGLIDTTIFNKNYPNDPNNKNYKDRERIIARINTEKLGSQYGVNSPVGIPCKK